MKAIIECSLGAMPPAGALPTENALAYGCEACEYIYGNTLHRCNEFICIAGQQPDGKHVDEWKCCKAWMPILLTEISMTNRGQTGAIESLRNESIKRQDALFDAVTGQFLLP